jgi:hypothetical protein
LLAQAKRAALDSPDLTRADKVRIVKGIDAEFNAPSQPKIAAGSGASPAPSTALERAVARVSAKDAVADPLFHDPALLERSAMAGDF